MMAAVNVVVGDESWIMETGAPPPPGALEQERISCHLRFALGRLRERHSNNDKRASALEALEQYIEEGEFPRHDTCFGEGRSPLFIDSRGVHCAVAAMMARTGAGDLAQAVNETWPTARVHHFDLGAAVGRDVKAWADACSLSLEELALVQPTYEFLNKSPVPLERPELVNSPSHGFEHGRMVVRTLTSGDIVLDVEPNDTVLRVKEMIRDQKGIPVEQMRLLSSGTELEDQRTLAEYRGGMAEGQVHLVLKLV